MPALICHAVHLLGKIRNGIPVFNPHRIHGHKLFVTRVVGYIIEGILACRGRGDWRGAEQIGGIGGQYLWIIRHRQPTLGSQQEKTFALLWNTEILGIEYAPRLSNAISAFFEFRDQQSQKLTVFTDGKSLYILKYKIFGIEVYDESHKLPYEQISRVIQHALPDQRKTLAGGTTANNIYPALAVLSIMTRQN